MANLALSEDILLNIDKSARYIGGEVNSIIKNENNIDIRFAICFPDCYEIGMSNLGIQILYDLFNKREDTWCERAFTPWPDLISIMREKQIPLFALESQEPVKDFDFFGMNLGYEMCYTNILITLELAQIPIFAGDRGENDPLVIGGGPCTYNPEPIADFFDLFYIGEGEVSYDSLFDLYKEHRLQKLSRAEFLRKAATIKGIYVPSLYQADYDERGVIKDIRPIYEDVPKKAERVIQKEFATTHSVLNPVIPHIQATQDRMVQEIQRGCIRGCRFCQAGMTYRPNREKDMDILKQDALTLMSNTGYEEISLSSLSSSDYHSLPEYLDFLIAECSRQKINISLPSLRIDAVSVDTLKKIGDVRKSSITFAPEAGSQRMRDVINKDISYEDIMNGARLAFLAGFRNIKLYFMLGLPTETDEDVLAIADIAEDLMMVFYDNVPKEQRKGPAHITVSTSFFVPKPFTPFQWESMLSSDEYKAKAIMLKEAIKKKVHGKHISYQWHSPDETVLEGILARGDRRVSAVIYDVYKNGGMYDAWSEFFDNEKWLNAFNNTGVFPGPYNNRERNITEKLPWDHIDIGVSRRFLEKERELSYLSVITPNCKEDCSHCGCKKYGCGVCVEKYEH